MAQQYGAAEQEDPAESGAVAATPRPPSGGHSCAFVALALLSGAGALMVSLCSLYKINSIADSTASAQADSTESLGKILQEIRTVKAATSAGGSHDSRIWEELRTVNGKLDALGGGPLKSASTVAMASAECSLPPGGKWCQVRKVGVQPYDIAVYAQGDIVSDEICRSGSFEGGLIDSVLRSFGTPGVALDIGANIGTYSLALAKAGWRVHAFEPMTANLALLKATLCKNVDVQHLVTVHPVGLGPSPIRCAIESGRDNIGDGTLKCDERFQDLHVGDGHPDDASFIMREFFWTVRLDDELKRSSVTNIDFVKIDVEGFECQVFKGGSSILSHYRPKLILSEVNPGNMDGCESGDYLRQFKDANYTVSHEDDEQCATDICCVAGPGIGNFRFCNQDL